MRIAPAATVLAAAVTLGAIGLGTAHADTGRWGGQRGGWNQPPAGTTGAPTAAPTAVPTVAPTTVPTVAPTTVPTVVPTAVPTVVPTAVPTVVPTTGAPVPAQPGGATETCEASWYGEVGEIPPGSFTASGEIFDASVMAAAHKTLPFGTNVLVTNLATGATVTVRINDRGPFVAGRCIDLTKSAFSVIADTGAGVTQVSVQVL